MNIVSCREEIRALRLRLEEVLKSQSELRQAAEASSHSNSSRSSSNNDNDNNNSSGEKATSKVNALRGRVGGATPRRPAQDLSTTRRDVRANTTGGFQTSPLPRFSESTSSSEPSALVSSLSLRSSTASSDGAGAGGGGFAASRNNRGAQPRPPHSYMYTDGKGSSSVDGSGSSLDFEADAARASQVRK